MNELLFWISVMIIAMCIPIASVLVVYWLSLRDIFFTQVPQGEIIAVMIGKEVIRFLGNIADHWVDEKTGEIWRTRRLNDGFDDIAPDGTHAPNARIKQPPLNHPHSFFGISYMGPWPFARRHVYKFKWNKWEKAPGSDKSDFDIRARDEMVDSLYWKSGYAFKVSGAETRERIPVDAKLVLTVRVVNANTALFGVLNGWFATLDGKVLGAGRDFIGSTELEELITLQHEEGDVPSEKAPSMTRRSFVGKMMFLNDDPPNAGSAEPKGNEGVRKTLGVEIVTASFVDYEIAAGSIKERVEETTVMAYQAEQRAAAMDTETAALKKREEDVGSAKARAAGELAAAMQSNPQVAMVKVAELQREAALAWAEAIKEQKGAKQLIIGGSVMPVVSGSMEDGK